MKPFVPRFPKKKLRGSKRRRSKSSTPSPSKDREAAGPSAAVAGPSSRQLPSPPPLGREPVTDWDLRRRLTRGYTQQCRYAPGEAPVEVTVQLNGLMDMKDMSLVDCPRDVAVRYGYLPPVPVPGEGDPFYILVKYRPELIVDVNRY